MTARLPHEVPVGSYRASAGGGGSVEVSYVATTATLEEVIAALSVENRPPREVTDVSAEWRHSSPGIPWTTVAVTRVWVVGRGGAPGFEPTLVPPTARCVVSRGSLTRKSLLVSRPLWAGLAVVVLLVILVATLTG